MNNQVFKHKVKADIRDINKTINGMLKYIDYLENTIHCLKLDRAMLEEYLPKHGEIWEKLPTSCGLCRVGWSLGNGIHRIDKHTKMDWGTLHQVLHGSLRKI